MSRAFRDYFIKELKKQKKHGPESVMNEFSSLRTAQHSKFYPYLISALEDSDPKLFGHLQTKGQANFRDLLWNNPYQPLPLEKELAFASSWLCRQKKIINEFRDFSLQIEELVCKGDFSSALKDISEFRKSNGWSMWGTELEYSLAFLALSAAESRKYISDISENSSPRIASLIDMVLRDRNYPEMKIVGFIRKCENSFPRLGFPDYIEKYLYYRAFSQAGDIKKYGGAYLATDLSISPFDYYETVVDICAAICASKLGEFFQPVEELVSILIETGFKDSRLFRIFQICTDFKTISPKNKKTSDGSEIIIQSILGEEMSSPGYSSDFFNGILKRVEVLKEKGSSQQDEFEWVFKAGLNFKGLFFGSSLLSFINTVVGTNFETIVSPWLQFGSSKLRIEDILSVQPNNIIEVLDSIEIKTDDVILKEDCKSAILLINEEEFTKNAKNNILLWKAFQDINLNKLSHADNIILELESRDNIEERDRLRVRLLWSLKSQDFEKVIEISSTFMLHDQRNGVMLPLKEIFGGRKWRDFKHLDPVKVGIVSNAASQILNDSNIKYICGMACRAYGIKTNGDDKTYFQNGKLKYTISFLKNVWIEDNLTMAGFLTTQEVQKNRISTLQKLVGIDLDDNGNPKSEYTDEIKELVFKETLLEGLKQVEGSRVFVNEGPILRWAQSELQADYAKWKALVAIQNEIFPSLDEMVRNYFLKINSSLDISFANGAKTEADLVLWSIFERLLSRFLTDQADGLNCYLSSRIRHGTLKGTLLGPLEESGLLGMSESEIETDWRVIMGGIEGSNLEDVKILLLNFNKEINNVTTKIINEKIQIRSKEHLNGAIFPSDITSIHFETLSSMAANSDFTEFAIQCFDIYWLMLAPSLNALSNHFRSDVKNEVQSLFDGLIQSLRRLSTSTSTMTTSLRTVATATQGQCDLIGSWFNYDQSIEVKVFPLETAVKIASATTRNIYRLFPSDSIFVYDLEKDFSLTSLGLLAITDCLYIMLENSFKHSGLGDGIGSLHIVASFIKEDKILKLAVSNPLSIEKLNNLRDGGLKVLSDNYIKNSSIDKATTEGGSGFAKLLRITRTIDRIKYPEPLNISLNKDMLCTTLCVPVYSRGDSYDAYFG